MPDDAMAPTLGESDRVAWSPLASGVPLHVGEAIVFSVGGGPTDVHLARVVGVGPTEVSFVDHLVMASNDGAVDHTPVAEPCRGFVGEQGCAVFVEQSATHRWRVQRLVASERGDDVPLGQWSVPADHLFVAGDNRVLSQDSRHGAGEKGRPLPLSAVLGRVVAVERDGRCAPLDRP